MHDSSIASRQCMLVQSSALVCGCGCCLQVSDKERQAQQDNLFKDVAGVLVEKTVSWQCLKGGLPVPMRKLPGCFGGLHSVKASLEQTRVCTHVYIAVTS